MNRLSFEKLVRFELLGSMENSGFSCRSSMYCTFYRELANDIYHFIAPDISSDGTWFDVRVFAHCPRIDPLFRERFPDSLGIPSGTLSFLHDRTGVGLDQKRYRCRTEEGLIRNIRSEVLPEIHEYALPYLNKIRSLEDLRGVSVDSFYKSVLDLMLLPSFDAREAAKLEISRLQQLDTSDKVVISSINFIKSLL